MGSISANVRYLNSILFNDEATFHTSGGVNHQNCRIWSSENLYTITEHAGDSSKVSLYCETVSDCTISPSLLTGHNHLRSLPGYFGEILFPQTAEINSLIFQWHSAAPCFGNIVHKALDIHFRDWGIGKGGLVSWPLRGPDLSPVDFWAVSRI
jgi:hypothetical protein